MQRGIIFLASNNYNWKLTELKNVSGWTLGRICIGECRETIS